MHTLDEIELAILGIAVYRIRVFALRNFELFENVCVSVVVPAQKAVLFSTEPPVPEGELHDAPRL